MKAEHTKVKGKKKSAWRRAGRPLSAGDWLVLCALAVVIVALCWTGARWLSGERTVSGDGRIVINRVMSSNPATCFSVQGRYYDWIELVNASDAPVSLDGWRLGDSLDQREAYALDGISLPGHGSLIVYCAPRPEDYEGGEVFCGFKLSANGELLVLSDAHRQLAQVLDVPAMAASEVYQRGEDGGYSVVPFERMLAEGAVDLRPAFEPNRVRINEVMASNRTILQDGDGDWSDWIELYNGSSQPVDLSGCALSDDDVNQRKWVFPALTLQPGEYRLVFASGKDRREGELHANFKLSSSGEALRLYDAQGEVLSWVEYGALPAETSLSRLPDGSLTTELRPTPGYENTEASVRDALSVAGTNVRGLYINEIMSSGSGFDWLELYNAEEETIDLSGMGLSDDTRHPRRWQFPEGASIPAKGYLIVALTGAEGENGVSQGYFCANFGLSAGETATLALPDGALLDRVTLFEQHRDISYGRASGQEHFRYFTQPTPGKANDKKSYAGKASEVVFSEPGGQHKGKKLTVALSGDEGMSIYYTIDGTTPTTRSQRYSDPIKLEHNTVIKAVAWREDVIPSDLCVRTYLLEANHGLRIVSVSGKRSALNASTGMLNTGVKGTGSEAYVEVYEPDGTRALGQRCLMKLAGHSTRINQPQKGFSLRARKEYGVSRFNYPLFSKRDYPSYKSFVMRASGQDGTQSFMRDSILSALAADTSVLYRETEVSVLYVNGRYWGVYNMRERVCEDMIAQFEGWDNPDDVEFKEGMGMSSPSYRALLHWVGNHDLSKDANIEELRKKMDIENYLEYVMLEMFANNQDLNNVGFYRNAKTNSPWRWALFDLDLSFQLNGDNVKDWLHGDSAGSITPQKNMLFKNLMKNAGVKDWFLRRMGELLATTFSAENVTSMIQERYNLLQPEMSAECKRWKWSVNTWKRYVQRIVSYAKKRPKNMIKYLSDDFRLNDAQIQDYFGEAMAKNGID